MWAESTAYSLYMTEIKTKVCMALTENYREQKTNTLSFIFLFLVEKSTYADT